MDDWDKFSKEMNELEFSDYRLDEYRDCMKLNDNPFDNKLYSTHSDNIRDKFRNKKFNRYKTMGKLRKYNTHEFINDGEKLITKSFEHDKSGVKIKDIIKGAKEEGMLESHIYHGLPLPITKNCKLVGIVRGRRRRTGSKIRNYERDVMLENFIDKVDVGYKNDDFSYLKPYGGDWLHNSQNLIDMATPKEKYFTRHQIMEGYLSRRNIDLRLPYIGEYDPKFILNQDVNPKAFPGFSTHRKIAKFRKNSSPFTKEYAYKYAQRVMSEEDQILDTSLIVVGGREKRVKYDVDEKGKKVKTRVTCMHEDVPALISGSVVNPITNCLPEINDNFCQLAKVYGQGNMQRFVDTLNPNSWKELVCDLDYSGHDNNTSEEQVVAAFALFRLCFKECKKIDKIFYYIMSSMIHKRIVLPETNMVYHINKGISTGHGFVALCTTFCAYGTLATAINIVLKKKSKFLRNKYLGSSAICNAGDDVNIKLNVDINEEVYHEVINNSGHKVDDMRNNGYHISNNYSSRVTFLKKKFIEYSWNYPELFTNLVHPTLKEKNFGRRSENLKVLMYQSPLDLRFNNMLTCLIICYILSGIGYTNKDILAAQVDGRTMNVLTLMDKCCEIGWNNPKFIDKLLELQYGEFSAYNYDTKGNTLIDEIRLFGYDTVNLDKYIKDQLILIRNELVKKRNWFSRNVRFKMHRVKNTLTVYDFMKIYVKPKSNNISFETFRIHYNKMRIINNESTNNSDEQLIIDDAFLNVDSLRQLLYDNKIDSHINQLYYTFY